uniref:ShKT domain-containing protein n=1 Tax=Parastrongyloides trichosuri TaxID=131310 RepID=A0A0N4Z619_PARTI
MYKIFCIINFIIFITITLGQYTTTIGSCQGGLCPKDYSCMTNLCVKTTTSSGSLTTQKTTTTKSQSNICTDKQSNCSSMKNLCTNTIYKSLMKQQCPRSCNFC